MDNSAFMENLRQLFAECDVDNNGCLGRDEFSELCAKIGLNREAAHETFDRLDIDKDDKITFDEFAAGFNQYKSSSAAATTTTPPPTTTTTTTTANLSANNHLTITNQQSDNHQQQHPFIKKPPSPASTLARKSASPVGILSLGGSATSTTPTTTISGASSSSNNLLGLTKTSTTSSGGGGSADISDFNGVDTASSSFYGGTASALRQPDESIVVYSSETTGQDYYDQPTGSGSQFNSLFGGGGGSMNGSGNFSQVRNMQELLDCVQKLQSENQILSQIFFKDKREREEYISQLGEEFDQQVREVEERANRRAREELEAEKRRLREMMQAERETLQHHYKTIEKMSKIIHQTPQAGASSSDLLLDGEGIDKVKSKLEDTHAENRQLKRSLLDTKTDVAMIWKEMEKLKRQYEDKLSSAYQKNNETRNECDHIKQQLNLMKDSNRKLQDASDVITTYITDKVDPVIKGATSSGPDDQYLSPNGCHSLTGSLRLGGGSQSNSRRGSVLSEYLNSHPDSMDEDEDMEPKTAAVAASAAVDSTPVIPPTKEKENQQVLKKISTPEPESQEKARAKLQTSSSQLDTSTPKAPSRESSLKNLGRHFFIGSKDKLSSSRESSAPASAEVLAKTKSLSLDTSGGEPLVEPADGPSVATFNIILVGDSFVGKSSFAARFMEGNFVQGLISNCSIDFKTKSYKVDGVNYTVNLWDTAGQERFRSITASYFRKADGIILMYDVTDKRSYLNVRNWMSTISDTASENVAVLLVGNKIDLRVEKNKDKCVPHSEGFRLAKEYDIVFLETSVKTGTNLIPSMGRLIRLIAKNNSPEEKDDDTIRLNDKNKSFHCMPKNC